MILCFIEFWKYGSRISGQQCTVCCIRRLRQHLVHAFSSRPSSSTDFPERVDSICRAICSEYGIAGAQTQGLFSFSSLFTGLSNRVQNFTCVHTHTLARARAHARCTEENNTVRKRKRKIREREKL